MKRFLAFPFAALFAASTAFAQVKPAALPAPPVPQFKPLVEKLDLKDGDTIVFLGDSITHQCLYTQYVEDYFYTRYPKLKIRFHNSGVGGDRAGDALLRFDEDVAAYKPKYVTILLGMNDGTYRDFDKTVFDNYQAGMNTVLDKIAALGATAIPMTPTMFDARAKRLKGDNAEPRNTYYNGVLSLYGTWLREQAETRGLGFVDMWSPLNNVTMSERKKTPNFTLIKDGVHPDAPGQVIMAAAIIDQIVPRSQVSGITIQQIATAKAPAKLTPRATGGKITDFQTAEAAAGKPVLSFTFAANCLPWVLPPEAAEGFKLAKAGHRLSNEKITVRDLKPGKYELKIDGQPVGTYDATRLAAGVELEENDKTPQYQQALKVALLNKQRNDLAYHPLRDQYRELKLQRRELDKVAKDSPEFAGKKAAFDAFVVGQKAKVAELLAQAAGFEAQIYQANQPVPRKYELARVP